MTREGKAEDMYWEHTIVERGENPGLGGMKVNALDSLTASIKLALYGKRAVSCLVLRKVEA
jgi:hypothetical protein